MEEVETAASFNITCSQYGYARDPAKVLFHKDGLQLGSDEDSRYDIITLSEAQLGDRGNISTILRVNDARVNDSGHYTCSLQGAGPVNITVDVLPGECAVAMSLHWFKWVRVTGLIGPGMHVPSLRLATCMEVKFSVMPSKGNSGANEVLRYFWLLCQSYTSVIPIKTEKCRRNSSPEALNHFSETLYISHTYVVFVLP